MHLDRVLIHLKKPLNLQNESYLDTKLSKVINTGYPQTREKSENVNLGQGIDADTTQGIIPIFWELSVELEKSSN